MSYTLRQIGLFYREAVAAENDDQARAIVAANLGAAGGKSAKSALDKLARRP